MTPEDDAQRIAARIADGSGLDWPADADAASSHDRGVLEALKAIADVASAHRAPADTVDAASLTDRKWGPLTIVSRLARGGFSEVHRAWEPRLQREVALKLLDAPSPETASLPTRAIEEARLLARVRHPNVLTVYGAESVEGRVGIWTEFIDGRTLDALVRERGVLTPDEVVAIGLDLCRALAAVHDAGLIHRDIKAQNVMRETGGRIVLMDFGTGQDLARVKPREGDLSGTPLYLAPEIFAGGRPSVASDIYALGVLLFYLATGGYPVPGKTLAEVREAHGNHAHVAVRERRPGVPKELALAIERAISPDPAARFGSAAAFEHVLASADPRRRARARRRTWWSATAMLLIAATVGLTWWRSSVLTRPPGSQQRNWVLLTSFDNRTGDQEFDRTIEDALAYELRNSSYVNVVPRARIDDALRLMARPVDTVVDAAIGPEVARRDGGIRMVVDGAIDRLGGGYAMTVRVVDPHTGAVIATDRAEAASAAGVSGAVRQLSSWLRVTLGEAPLTVRQDADVLAKGTTPSPRAIRLYTEALYVFDLNRFGEAQALLGSALTEDPNFASAHIWMALTLYQLNRPREEYLRSAHKAVELASTATERERYWILGHWAAFAGKDDEAIGQFEALVQRYPDEIWPLQELSGLYNRTGRSQDVAPLMLRIADASPNNLYAQSSAAASVLARDGLDAARPYVARARHLVPPAGTNSTPRDAIATIGTLLFPAHDLWVHRRVREASAVLDSVSQRPEFDAEGQWTLMMLGGLRLTMGQLRLAEQTFNRVTDPGKRAIGLSQVALARNDSGAIVRELRSYKAADLSAVSLLVRAGDLDGAERLLGGYRFPEASNPMNQRWATEEIQQARGNAALVAEAIRADVPSTRAMTGVRVFLYSETLARAAAAAGDTAGAIHVLEGTAKLDERSYAFFTTSSYFAVRTQKLLADIYRQAGQVDKARAIERDLLSALSAADPDYPLLIELKNRAASRDNGTLLEVVAFVGGGALLVVAGLVGIRWFQNNYGTHNRLRGSVANSSGGVAAQINWAASSRPMEPGPSHVDRDNPLRIVTPRGVTITLASASARQIDEIKTCWALGLEHCQESPGRLGLVCKRPNQEATVVRFQQTEVPPDAAPLVRFQNRALIALALREYLRHGHRGFLMPCAYVTPRAGDRVETGIAYFVGPHAQGDAARNEGADNRWDEALGSGATAMVLDFAREVGRVMDKAPAGRSMAGREVGRPVFLTMELRPCSTLGVLEPQLAVIGTDVIVTIDHPHRTLDSTWDFVAGAGFTTLAHAVITPVELGQDGSMDALGSVQTDL